MMLIRGFFCIAANKTATYTSLLLSMPHLRVILDRFEHDRAVFLTQEGQQLVWHKDDLPEDIQEGQTYYIHFATSEQNTPPSIQQTLVTPKKSPTSKPTTQLVKRTPLSQEEKKQRLLARALLEEILNGTDATPTTTIQS